jgi:hypothetical protein
MSIINENCKNFALLNIDAKLVWLLNNENIDILCAIKGRCIRTNFHHYILKCIKCPVDLTTAVEERNISQLDIKLQERKLNMF